MALSNSTLVEAPRQTPMIVAMEELNKQIARCEENFGSLYDKLDPIKLNYPTEGAKTVGVPADPHSDLVNALTEFARRLDSLAVKILTTRDEVEL